MHQIVAPTPRAFIAVSYAPANLSILNRSGVLKGRRFSQTKIGMTVESTARELCVVKRWTRQSIGSGALPPTARSESTSPVSRTGAPAAGPGMGLARRRREMRRRNRPNASGEPGRVKAVHREPCTMYAMAPRFLLRTSGPDCRRAWSRRVSTRHW